MAIFYPEALLQQLYSSFNNPFQNTFFNPHPLDDPTWPEASMRVRIRAQGAWHEFGSYYVHQSYEREYPYGLERGKVTFKLAEFDADQNVMPFIPTAEMEVQFWNLAMTRRIARVRVVSVKQQGIAIRNDGSEVALYDILCVNSARLAERRLVFENFFSLTTGFLADYVIREYTFLQSGIDPESGSFIESFNSNGLNVAQILEWVLNREADWTLKIDESTEPYATVRMGPVTDHVIFQLNEDNKSEIVNWPSLVLGPNTEGVRTKIIATYKGLYTTGYANVGGGGPGISKIVYGIGTDWSGIKPGAKFRRKGSSAIYTVQDNRSLPYPSLKQELVLSSEFAEEQENGVEYELFDFPGYYEVQDDEAVQFMKNLLEEVGPNAGIIEFQMPDDGGFYTRDQVRQIAKTYLLNLSNPLIQGGFSTNSDKLNGIYPEPGDVVDVLLPDSKKVVFKARIKQWTEREAGPRLHMEDGSIEPFMEYEAELNDRMFDVNNQIRRLQLDVRRSEQRDSENILTGITRPERLYVFDALNILPGHQDLDVAQASDSDHSRDIASGALGMDYYTDSGTLIFSLTSFSLSTDA